MSAQEARARIAPRRSTSFLTSLRVNARVLSALVAREALSRYGHENLGFFWIMVEPLMFSGAVMIMWWAIRHAHMENVGLVLFVLTGYCSLTMWRHIVARSIRSVSNRAELLYHVNIRPLDLLLAFCILEVLGVFTAFVVAYVPLALFEVVHPIHDPLLLAGGFFCLGWFSTSVAMMFAGLSERYEVMEKFIPASLYVTIPLTGVFSLVDWLPQRAQTVLLYSPMVNAVEMFRAGVMPDDVVTRYSAVYLVGSCAFCTAVGLLMMKNVQKHLGS